MNLQNKIMMAIEHSGKEFNQVANEFFTTGTVSSNRQKFQNRIKTGKFNQDELKQIADILGCEYVSELMLSNGISLFDGNKKFATRTNQQLMNMRSRINVACGYAGINQNILCAKLGVSASLFTQRVQYDKFKVEELEKIASVLGGSYHCYFVFDDGVKI